MTVSEPEYARLAARVYGNSVSVRTAQNTLQLPTGWDEIRIQPDSMDFNSDVRSLADGFMASAYENAQGDVVISYAGTTNEGFAIADWLNGNVPAGSGAILASQLLDAASYYLDVVKSGIDPGRITFTGHSLGGGLASLMAVFFNSSATVFDEAPFLLSATSPAVIIELSAALAAAGYSIPSALLTYNPLTDLQSRESRVNQVFVTGEVLSSYAFLDSLKIMGGPPKPLNPMAGGLNVDLPSTKWGPDAAELHSIVLLNAFEIDPDFLTAVQAHPEFLARVFVGLFRELGPKGKSATLLDLLVQRQVAGEGSLTALSTDLNAVDEKIGLAGAGQVPGTSGAAGTVSLVNVAAVVDDVVVASLYAQGPDRKPVDTGLPAFNSILTKVSGGLSFDTSKFGIQTTKIDNELEALTEYLTPRGGTLHLDDQSALFDADFSASIPNATFVIQNGSSVLSYDGSTDTRPDILVGYTGDDAIAGSSQNDILVGGAGDDTLVGGGGNDLLIGGAGHDLYTFSATFGNDTIIDSDANGSIVLDGVTLSSAKAVSANTWVETDGSSGDNIGFAIYDDPKSAGGKSLVITRAGDVSNTVTIRDFDLSLAQSSAGFLGLHLKNSAKAVIGTFTSSQAFAANDSTQGSIGVDGSKSFSVLLGQSTAKAMTLVVKLSSGDAEDFGLAAGGQVIQFTNGEARVTIAAGEDAQTLALVNTKDPDQSISAELDFSLLNADGADSGIAVNSLAFNLSETAATTVQFTPLPGVRQSDDLYFYDLSSGSYDSSGNFLVNAGDTRNWIATANGNDSITSGSGDDTISSGDGNDTIIGGGGSDVIMTGDFTVDTSGNTVGDANSDSEIYADQKINLDTAIENAVNGSATNAKGDAIGVGDGDNTIVGGTGNDLISVGQGDNVIVAGPGQDLIMTGNAAVSSQSDWSWAPTDSWDVSIQDFGVLTAQYDIGSSVYEGVKSFDTASQAWLPVGVGDDTIYGGAGDSTILLTNGDNYVDAGGGDDLIEGGMGEDTIFASSGDVTVAGGGGDTYIDGESGDDLLYGEGGDNTIMGGSGNDTIFAGDDAFFATKYHNSTWDKAETGNNYVDGGSGNDLIYGSGGNDTLIAGSGTTTIRGGYGNESIEGGSGTDVLLSGSGAVGSDGAGITTIVAGGGSTTIVGGAGDDSLYGGDGTDFIQAGSGNQYIDAGDGGTDDAPTQVLLSSGHSTVYGGSGVDQVQGGSGDDTLFAGTGDTTLTGGSATDVMYAGEGNDLLIATTGSDTLYGGAGDATLQGGSGTVEMHAGDGADVLIAGSGNATLYGGMGDATLQGGSGDATMYAGDGDEALIATSGAATIYGGAGDDVMQGGAATTLMVAGAGSTTMIGGSGQDTFQVGANAGDVVIGSFAAGDVLQLADGVSIGDLNISNGSSSDGSVDGLEIDLGNGGSVLLAAGDYNDLKISFSGDGSTYTLDQLIDSTNSLTTVVLADGSMGYRAATANGSGQSSVSIYDANGNELTASNVSNDGHGNLANTTFSSSGAKLSSSYSTANGSSGSTTYAPDGSSTAHTNNADGTSTTTLDDGASNSETTMYRGGSFAGDSWSKADGSLGDDQVNPDGSSSSNVYDAADGTTTHITSDALGNTTTIVDASDGTEVSAVVSHVDGSSVAETFSSTGRITSTTTISSDGTKTVAADDGLGDVSTLTTQSGIQVSGSWSKSDGTRGTEVMVGGVETDFAYAADNSYTKTVRDQAGNTSWITVDATGGQTSSAYANADGSYGDTTVESDGSTLTRNHHRDGSYVEVTVATSGDSRTVSYSADGTELSETSVVNGVSTTTSAGVASAVSNFEKDGVFARGVVNSGVVVGLYSASGSELTRYDTYSPDLNAGYGGEPDYKTFSIEQLTVLQNGDSELQNPLPFDDPGSQVGVNPHLVREDSSTGSDGPAFNFASKGQIGSTTTTSSPPTKPVTASTLVLTPIGGSEIGIAVANDGTPPLYVYDQSSNAVYDLSGNREPVAIANFSSLSSALTYVAARINTERVSTTYSDGSTFTYTTGKLYGEINDTVFTDLAGDYAHYHVDEETFAQTLEGHNASGDSYTGTDTSTVIRYADGRIAESDTGSSNDPEQYDIVNDPFGNTISTHVFGGESAEDVSVDSLGDVIKSDFSAMGSYGTEAVNTSWTEADGTTVSASIDLTTGAGDERMNYTDGSYTVLHNDSVGNFAGVDYSAQGMAVGYEWGHADGSHGSNSTTAADNELDKWSNADGSHGSQVIDAVTGEVIGSSVNADGSTQSSWDDVKLENGQVESLSKEYGTDGTVTSYDKIAQADGSYIQTWTRTDGSSGTYNLDAATGELTGTSSDMQGNTSVTDKIQLGGGVVDSKETDNDIDGSQSSIDTVTQPSGSYTQSWSHSDGSHGTNVLDAASGEASGSKVSADGSETDTWDTVTRSDGSQESRTATLFADGTGTSYDTVTQANGSYQQTWTSPDGSSGTNTFDAKNGETTGSIDTVGSGVVVSWDRFTYNDGSTEQDAEYDYDDGSRVYTYAYTYLDGASEQDWGKSDGETGSSYVGVQSDTGDTFYWDPSTHYGTLQTISGKDSLAVSDGVSADQLWFNRDGNDLYLSVVGTDNYLDVQGWYTGTNAQLTTIQLADGQTLDRADVQKLVDAMAAFAPPGSAQSQYTPAERDALTPVLAANWH